MGEYFPINMYMTPKFFYVDSKILMAVAKLNN